MATATATDRDSCSSGFRVYTHIHTLDTVFLCPPLGTEPLAKAPFRLHLTQTTHPLFFLHYMTIYPNTYRTKESTVHPYKEQRTSVAAKPLYIDQR